LLIVLPGFFVIWQMTKDGNPTERCVNFQTVRLDLLFWWTIWAGIAVVLGVYQFTFMPLFVCWYYRVAISDLCQTPLFFKSFFS